MLVDLRAAVEEAPQEGREASALLQFQERAGVVDHGLDLEAVAHDAGVAHQAGDVLGAVAGDAVGIEAVEGLAEVLALPEDRQPRQAGLEAFEDELLEQGAIVGIGTPHSSS